LKGHIVINTPLRRMFSIAVLAGCVAASPLLADGAADTVREVMNRMTIPASTAIFDISEPPKSDAEWKAAERHGVALIEGANLLLTGDRVRDDGEWMAQARAHRDAAIAVATAAGSHKFEALLEASDALALTCVNCHKSYLQP
jgi:hypothetical protein